MSKLIKFSVLILSLVLIYTIVGKAARMIYPIEHEENVKKYALEYDLSEKLVYAVIKAESNFNHEAKSAKNAYGLMQITETTGKWIADRLNMENFSNELLTAPEANIEMGCFYLSYLLNMYNGDKKCALAAYNAGHANVDSWLRNKKYSANGTELDIIPFPETEKYVNLVMKNEKIYDYLYGE